MERDCNSQDKPELWAKGCLWEYSASSAENIAERGRTYPRSWHRGGHRHLHQSNTTAWLVLSSTGASAEEGAVVAAVQVRRASCSAFVSMCCSQKKANLFCCLRPLTLGGLQHSFPLRRRSAGPDPFLPQLWPVQGGWTLNCTAHTAVATAVHKRWCLWISLATVAGQPDGGLRQAEEEGRLGIGEGCPHDDAAFTRKSNGQEPPAASSAQRGGGWDLWVSWRGRNLTPAPPSDKQCCAVSSALLKSA